MSNGKEVVTSNFVYVTVQRLDAIKQFMYEHDDDLLKLSDEQRKMWHNVLDGIISIEACDRVLHYITDDLRKMEDEHRGD